jgi:hypothetical protein
VSLFELPPTSRLYGLGEAEADGEAEGEGEGDGEAEGEALGDGEAVCSVISGPVEGVGVVVMVGSVSSVVRIGGSYGLLNTTDNASPTTIAPNTTTGVSTATRGARTNGRTHPSMMYHRSAATTASTAPASHHGYPRIKMGRPATPLRLSAATREVYRACISSSVSRTTLDLWPALSGTPSCAGRSSGRHIHIHAPAREGLPCR